MSFKSRFKLVAIAALMAGGADAADYQLQTLESAHGLFRSATNSTMFAEAARQYEFLVNEEGVRNGHLFYTMGNSWFMAGDVGRAILNYRRALERLPTDADVRHNLNAARALRADLIPTKKPRPIVARFFGWHLHTPTAARWWLFAAVWLVFWGAWLWTRRSTKKEARITAAATGVLSLVLLGSLIVDAVVKRRAAPGVIVANEAMARKGDGEMYAPAFLEPLRSGTEFQRLESRGEWWHIRLADGQTCWIRAAAAETVAF